MMKVRKRNEKPADKWSTGWIRTRCPWVNTFHLEILMRRRPEVKPHEPSTPPRNPLALNSSAQALARV